MKRIQLQFYNYGAHSLSRLELMEDLLQTPQLDTHLYLRRNGQNIGELANAIQYGTEYTFHFHVLGMLLSRQNTANRRKLISRRLTLQ